MKRSIVAFFILYISLFVILLVIPTAMAVQDRNLSILGLIGPITGAIIGLIAGSRFAYKLDRERRPEVSPRESRLFVRRRLILLGIFAVLYVLILYFLILFISRLF